MTKTYNINELLELRKHLEEKYDQLRSEVTDVSMMQVVEVQIDHTNSDVKSIREDEKQTLMEYTSELMGVQDELAKVKTAITQYNAEKLKGLLFKREAIRNKIELMKKIKGKLPLDPIVQRRDIRTGKDGEALETQQRTLTPLFNRKEVDKFHDNLASEERKLNTEIQRLNLNEKIELQ